MKSLIIIAISCLLARGAWGAIAFTTPTGGNGVAGTVLAENVAVATTAETVVATTGGTTVVYTIVSVDGDTSSTLFAIGGGGSDEVQCKATPGFDYETKKSYVVLVQGVDDDSPSLTATATLTVRISDIDDNESTMQQTCGSATSDALSGDVVANVAVCDADVNSAITYAKVAAGSTDAPAFDVSSAGIVTKSATAFVSSTETSYKLVYTASGQVNTFTGTVTITIGGSCGCLTTSDSDSSSSGLTFGLFTLLAALVMHKI